MQDYEAIRERIARWLGWRDIQREAYTPTGKAMCGTRPDGESGIWGTHRGYCPDPLNNPADAWTVQCAIEDKNLAIKRGKTIKGTYLCRIHDMVYLATGEGETPAEALVMAWAQAFPAEEGE